MIVPYEPQLFDEIDITEPHEPVAHRLNRKVVTYGQAVDIGAIATITRLCPVCTTLQSIEHREVRIKSEGHWHGTTVADLTTGEPISPTCSVRIRLPLGDVTRADVIAYYVVDGVLSLCQRCVQKE
jgi:hypothetical protein